jgi:regulator of protease activity HflC (stomatin/prohibitin superfamily)
MASNDNDRSVESEHIETFPTFYKTVTIITVLILILAPVFAPAKFLWWILIPELLYLALSGRILAAEDVGGIFVFGVPTILAKAGPNVVFPGMMSMKTVRGYPLEIQAPADPEYVFNGDDRDPLGTHADGTPMVRPIRVTSGGPNAEFEKINPILNIQMTTKATGTVRPRISNFFDFWVRLAGTTEEEKLVELKRQLVDTWVSAVTLEWAKRPIGMIIRDQREIQVEIRKVMDTAAVSRGVDLYESTLVTPDLSHELAKKLAGIGEAKAQAIATRTTAEAEAFASVQAGQAAAEVALAMAITKAESERLDGIAAAGAFLAKEIADVDADTYRMEKMNITGEQMFAADTAARVLGDKDKFFFGAQGIAEGLAAGATVINALKSASVLKEPAKVASKKETKTAPKKKAKGRKS